MEDSSEKIEEEEISVLRGEGYYFRRIISRDPSIGSSDGFLYFCPGKVPFDWEMQPGKSKTMARTADWTPPIRPPPPLSSAEPIPTPKAPGSGWSRAKFWGKVKKHWAQGKIRGMRSVDGLRRLDFHSWGNHRGIRIPDSCTRIITPSCISNVSSSGSSSSRDSCLPPWSISKIRTLAKIWPNGHVRCLPLR